MSGVVVTCGILLVFLISIGDLQETPSASSSQHLHQLIALEEKKEAHFLFITHDISNICTFKLSYNRVTFNTNGKEIFSKKFPYDKILRTSVHVQSAFGFLGVSVSIKNTHATDKGIYQCRFMCNTTTTVQKAKLLVYYPPSPVDCTWLNKEDVPLEGATYFNLTVLQCRGQNSYPKADVLCYSNDNHNTQIHTPLYITDQRYYTATFWLKRDQDLSCCSVSTRFTKNIQDCDDFHSLQHPTKITDHTVDTSMRSPVKTTKTKAVKESINQGTLDINKNHSKKGKLKEGEDCKIELPCSYTEYRTAVVTLTFLCVALTVLVFLRPFKKW